MALMPSFTGIAACEMDTDARGFVTDEAPAFPIARAQVFELAIHKKTQEFVAEGRIEDVVIVLVPQ